MESYEADTWHEKDQLKNKQWVKCNVYENASNTEEIIFLWNIEESRVLLEKSTILILSDRDSSGLIWIQNSKKWNSDNDSITYSSSNFFKSANTETSFVSQVHSNVNIADPEYNKHNHLTGDDNKNTEVHIDPTNNNLNDKNDADDKNTEVHIDLTNNNLNDKNDADDTYDPIDVADIEEVEYFVDASGVKKHSKHLYFNTKITYCNLLFIYLEIFPFPPPSILEAEQKMAEELSKLYNQPLQLHNVIMSVGGIDLKLNAFHYSSLNTEQPTNRKTKRSYINENYLLNLYRLILFAHFTIVHT